MDNKNGTITIVRNLTGTLSGVSNLNGSLSTTGTVSGNVNIPREVAIKDHVRLTGRDAPDQHPIDAITDLPISLENLQTVAITNQEIEDLLS